MELQPIKLESQTQLNSNKSDDIQSYYLVELIEKITNNYFDPLIEIILWIQKHQTSHPHESNVEWESIRQS